MGDFSVEVRLTKARVLSFKAFIVYYSGVIDCIMYRRKSGDPARGAAGDQERRAGTHLALEEHCIASRGRVGQ